MFDRVPALKCLWNLLAVTLNKQIIGYSRAINVEEMMGAITVSAF